VGPSTNEIGAGNEAAFFVPRRWLKRPEAT
jgi:hypothetical protein